MYFSQTVMTEADMVSLTLAEGMIEDMTVMVAMEIVIVIVTIMTVIDIAAIVTMMIDMVATVTTENETMIVMIMAIHEEEVDLLPHGITTETGESFETIMTPYSEVKGRDGFCQNRITILV